MSIYAKEQEIRDNGILELNKEALVNVAPGQNIAAIDMGNALFQAIISGTGREYTMPNALALCKLDDMDYYDESQVKLYENLVVEIDSGALKNRRERYFVGISATERENVNGPEWDTKKADSDRNIYMALTLLAYDSVKANPGDKEISITYDFLNTALPTRQVKAYRNILKKKLEGHHTVTFKFVPGIGDIIVKLEIKTCMVSIEGQAAHVALIRDPITLKIKDETLADETVIIADLGGGSFDPVGIRERKMVEGIEGEPFGINTYLDRIITDVADNVGHYFPSRYSLECLLAKGPADWRVIVDQEEINITKYIEPKLVEMAAQYLSLIDKVRKNIKLQQARRIYPIGGPIKVSKKYIEEENDKRTKPMQLTFPENLQKLNVIGLWILVQAAAKVQAKEAHV
ncbi:MULTISPECIES: ParM/StbA family protein [Paenibacillus]|uniref:ParM/StbA family protein n=1 Tax=Paenibacillus TaxID=44249 RepID=UPI001BD0D2F7|nr:ParM/StbA family protein [Paenibacillus dendritiformis]